MSIIRFFIGTIKFFSKHFFRLIRFGIVSGATLAAVLYTIDSYTNSKYGVANLYLIAGSLSFFPLLTGTFFEIYFWLNRRESNKIKKMNTSYLKDSPKNELLERYNGRP